MLLTSLVGMLDSVKRSVNMLVGDTDQICNNIVVYSLCVIIL